MTLPLARTASKGNPTAGLSPGVVGESQLAGVLSPPDPAPAAGSPFKPCC